MLFDFEGIWVNDEEQIFYRNAKYKDVEHVGCRKVADDILPRLKNVEKQLLDQGYKQVYADRFEKYRKK